jgi:hypothetical protein
MKNHVKTSTYVLNIQERSMILIIDIRAQRHNPSSLQPDFTSKNTA